MTRTVTAEEYRKLVGAPPSLTRYAPLVQHQPPYLTTSMGRSDRFLGRLEAGRMNRTEAAYAEHLELRRRAGEVSWFTFEGVKLRLAKATFLTVDFFVTLTDGSIEIHEVKGFMRDDAAVKLKVAARLFPCFRFVVVRARSKRLSDGFTMKDVSDGL